MPRSPSDILPRPYGGGVRPEFSEIGKLQTGLVGPDRAFEEFTKNIYTLYTDLHCCLDYISSAKDTPSAMVEGWKTFVEQYDAFDNRFLQIAAVRKTTAEPWTITNFVARHAHGIMEQFLRFLHSLVGMVPLPALLAFLTPAGNIALTAKGCTQEVRNNMCVEHVIFNHYNRMQMTLDNLKKRLFEEVEKGTSVALDLDRLHKSCVTANLVTKLSLSMYLRAQRMFEGVVKCQPGSCDSEVCEKPWGVFSDCEPRRNFRPLDTKDSFADPDWLDRVLFPAYRIKVLSLLSNDEATNAKSTPKEAGKAAPLTRPVSSPPSSPRPSGPPLLTVPPKTPPVTPPSTPRKLPGPPLAAPNPRFPVLRAVPQQPHSEAPKKSYPGIVYSQQVRDRNDLAFRRLGLRLPPRGDTPSRAAGPHGTIL